MNRFIFKILFFFLICLRSAVFSTPVWLDTIAPKIFIAPADKYHTDLFIVTFSADERAVVWFSSTISNNFTKYSKPVTIADEGLHTFYYYGEDDFGNRSSIDSISYILDTRTPVLNIFPSSGIYSQPVVVHAFADEPCKFYLQETGKDKLIQFPDSFVVKNGFKGVVIAQDSAGNQRRSSTLDYLIDTTQFNMKITPQGGIYNIPTKIILSVPSGIDAYYSLDPLSPPEWFVKYDKPVFLPHGLTIFRYYGKAHSGNKTEIFKNRFILDTIPPKLQYKIVLGTNADTLLLICREAARIRYTLDNKIPSDDSKLYTQKLIVPHRGRYTMKAKAWDEAGNSSELVSWEYKYDKLPPKISISNSGGSFNRSQTITFNADEPVKIFYTLDGSQVTSKSLLYTNNGLHLSKNDTTILRYFGIDESGNISQEQSAKFFIDTKMPKVKVRIEGKMADESYLIHLNVNEPATVFYRTDGQIPDRKSTIYSNPVRMFNGQSMQYFAVDDVGNASPVETMNELKSPMINAEPTGGVYNKRLKIKFEKSNSGNVMWRTLPDTVFKIAADVVAFENEGVYSFEYYLETENGMRSVIHRNEYLIDYTSPHVNVSLKKGINDSVYIFFECSEKSSIFYTLDGSNPLVSRTTRLAGNKFVSSNDRITVKKISDLKLAFYAEDLAGNQSALSVLDIFAPRCVANIPSGTKILHKQVLSIVLNTYDKSTIYFERKGKKPTIESPVFTEPITLMQSDTIVAFVIDAAGFKGELDTFVYLIDLPPSPDFSYKPDTLYTGNEVLFNAGMSIDKESASEKLVYRWDFFGDGSFDNNWSSNPVISYKYLKTGLYKPLLEVKDENNRTAVVQKQIFIREHCPPDMISVIDPGGHSFCIDAYEWPNLKDSRPITGVSWVEAKMNCTDAGKRLCSSEEWFSSCQGFSVTSFPYGEKYDKKSCPTEGKEIWKSGKFTKCNKTGVFDMLGNAWEWVENRNGDYPLMMGGSFRFGSNAQCKQSLEGSIASKSDETGFRCCK